MMRDASCGPACITTRGGNTLALFVLPARVSSYGLGGGGWILGFLHSCIPPPSLSPFPVFFPLPRLFLFPFSHRCSVVFCFLRFLFSSSALPVAGPSPCSPLFFLFPSSFPFNPPPSYLFIPSSFHLSSSSFLFPLFSSLFLPSPSSLLLRSFHPLSSFSHSPFTRIRSFNLAR